MLTVNGHEFPSARTIDPATAWEEARYALAKAKPRVTRTALAGHRLSIGFSIRGANCFPQQELLRGIFQQGQVAVISSDDQRFWGDSKDVIVTCLGLDIKEESPTYYLATAQVEFRGNVGSTYMAYDVASVQDFNDYDLAGRTTVGFPLSSDLIHDPYEDGTNFAETLRGTTQIVSGYDALDTGSYVLDETKQATFLFLYDPDFGHSNQVQIYDDDDPITDAEHVFVGNFSIRNGLWRIVATGSQFEFQSADGLTTHEVFTMDTGLDTSKAKIICYNTEYCAILVENKITIEMFRGRDPIVHVYRDEFRYVNGTASAQESGGSDNSLQITGTSVYVASNGYFKTTTNKGILLQDGGDTNPSLLTTVPRFQIFVPSGDLATRRLEVLKRQG